jgi:hypothetical protein
MAAPAPADVRAIIKAATGRVASDAEIARALALAAAIDVPPRDPMFAAIVALDALHGNVARRITEIDKRVETAAKAAVAETARGARQIADDELRRAATDAHAALSRAVASAADRIVADSARRSMARWLVAATIVIACALTMTGWLAHRAGYSEGIGDVLATADLQKERSSWANTPDGARAFKLFKAGDLRRLVECDAPGWRPYDGVCIPDRDANGAIHGWRIR